MIPAADAGGVRPPDIPVLPPERGLERELALLRAVAAGQAERGRLVWTTGRCLVVPRFLTRLPSFAGARAALAAEGWPLHVRDTGGDVYPQGDGIVNLAITFRLPGGDFDRVGLAYSELCDPIVGAARDCGFSVRCEPVPGALCAGSHDLAVDGRKFAGVAQRWRQAESAAGRCDVALVHAGLLCIGDTALLVSAVNRFYRYCGLDRHAKVERHRTLFHDRDAASAWSMTARFVGRIVERLDHKASLAAACSEGQSRPPEIRLAALAVA